MSELYLGKVLGGDTVRGRYYHRLSDLVTHTFICGASGSGKTVIGKALIEEAALQGVPAIIIDLKGDLSSLSLAFPELTASMLAPWMQVEDEVSLGRTALAEANRVRTHLLEWGLTEVNIRRFNQKVAVEIFTPRSDRGRRIAIPLIPAAPPDIQQLFSDEPDTVLSIISSLAGALVRRVIPSGQRQREEEYMTALIEYAWQYKIDLTGEKGIHHLVDLILAPPFPKIGALTVEEHLPEKKQQRLAQAVNGQLVGISASWLQGEELTIDKLVGANRRDERVQISIVNLSAINEFEDQSFVVAYVAFAINSWMRQQGTAPLGNRPRLLFFIDEIGGGGGKTAFYPTYPYSSTAKPALNFLVRQGRAFGVGCLLATQNPGDIDYKGLSNCSTWIVGKLQTKCDRDKIREGLADAEFKPSDLTNKLASPKTGQFMVMTREGSITFIQERWLLTYHCTLTPTQLSRLKHNGLSPYGGALSTGIQLSALDYEDSKNTEYLWREVQEAIGIACKHLEAILEADSTDHRAQAMLEVLKNPEGIYQRLQVALAEVARKQSTKADPKPDAIAVWQSIFASRIQNPEVAELNPTEKLQPIDAVPRSEPDGTVIPNEQIVDDDGFVTHKGHRYALYRRYAGKPVQVIEEGSTLRFAIEGKVLSKSYALDHK